MFFCGDRCCVLFLYLKYTESKAITSYKGAFKTGLMNKKIFRWGFLFNFRDINPVMSQLEESDHYRTSVSEIWIDKENIMHVVFSKGVELHLSDMEEAYALFEKLGVGPGQRKSKQLLSGGPFTISKQAREYAGKSGTDFFIAAALVSDSVFMRFVINLFNSLQKHNVPFKVFATEEDALNWLRRF